MKAGESKWTKEQWAQVLDMHRAGMTADEIALNLGLTYHVVSGRMIRRGLSLNRKLVAGKPTRSQAVWTAADIALLELLRDEECLSWNEIAARMSRTPCAAQAKYSKACGNRGDWRGASDGVRETHVPSIVFTEREVRSAASDRRTLTQVFFGDPPPGFSALDRKRQAEGAGR